MSTDQKPRVYWAVWEDFEESEDGYRSGAISSEPGGNLHWEDHQIPFVEKSAYDAAETRTKELELLVESYRTKLANLLKYAEGCPQGSSVFEVNLFWRQREKAFEEARQVLEGK